ncbi:MAG TPA: metalloregulator ArsR/SmtB family transcription factor [Candidatus Peribacteria bacterium]|nr:metalloregulator ArsR/SmtB family transcription factor [Candidatus Peribacteria bacterium]
MVESSLKLDVIFGSLADPTRRAILKQVSVKEMSIGEIAEPYGMTFAAISKHLKILEKAELIIKRRYGKQQMVQLSPKAFKEANAYLKHYEKMWNDRLDSLEHYLATLPKE